MRNGSGKVSMVRKDSAKVNLIQVVVAWYTGIPFVSSRGSYEKFSFPVKKNKVVEVDRLLDTRVVELEIGNHWVSVTLTGDVRDRYNLYNLLCRQLDQHLYESLNRAKISV